MIDGRDRTKLIDGLDRQVAAVRDVLATPADVWPDQRQANEIAHQKAQRYLKQTEDLF